MSDDIGGAVVGVGELPPRRTTPGATTLGLMARAARLAVDDAGLAPADVDGLFVDPMPGETPRHVPVTVAEYLGLRPDVATLVDLGGATAVGMLWRAASAIAAGMCTTALCVVGTSRDPDRPLPATNRNPIREFDVPVGASGANVAYALTARAHMDRYGTTAEQLARIAVAARTNAQSNPEAVFHGRPIDLAGVLASPMVVDPIHRDEAVMPCGGAAAVLVTSAERAPDRPHAVVGIAGSGERASHRAARANPDHTASPLAPATAAALGRAGVSIADIDCFSLYDCYTIMVAVTAEDIGLCPPGEAGPFLWERDLGPEGDLPLNPHGGQLGAGQSDLAGGMGHVVEAVRQLRGTADGRQVPDCEVALVTGNGATMGESATTVLVTT